jgi:hypothetical protein
MEYMRVRDLVPNPRNPKRHDVPGITAAMKRFGYIDASIIDERTGMLIGGHGRAEVLLWAQQLNMRPPEGIVVDGDGDWTQPVQRGWSSANDDEADAALVALNRFVERGGWDEQARLEILEQLARQPAGLDGVGYDLDEVDQMAKAARAPLPEPPSAEPQLGAMEYRLLIICEGESQQAELLNRFEQEGLTCQAVIV